MRFKRRKGTPERGKTQPPGHSRRRNILFHPGGGSPLKQLQLQIHLDRIYELDGPVPYVPPERKRNPTLRRTRDLVLEVTAACEFWRTLWRQNDG